MTSSSAQAAAAGRLAEIYQRYRHTLAEQLDVIDSATLAALAEGLGPEARAEAHRAAHKLAGSAGTFGFADASELARRIELALAPEAPLGSQELLKLSEWVVALRSALPLADEPTAAPDGEPEPAVPAGSSADAPTERRQLVLVDSDPELAERLTVEAAGRGFDVVVAEPAEDSPALLAATAVVLAWDAGEPDPAGARLSLLGRLAARDIPVIVLASGASFADRVEVARLGARGFLARPLPPGQVIDTVERVLARVQVDDMTVLAVDDDPAVLAAVAALLAQEGVSVLTLDDPLRFWDTLEECSPDLLMLDVDMPGLSGIDLCRVVRNDPRWAQLPVLFLTGSVDADTTRRVFEAGADDYVSKPVVGHELVMRIGNRLERLRLYRRLAETDPLTGVANRRKAMDHLTRLIALTTRYDQPLSVALLDLDRFKQVNDKHGHVAGDQVLRELAVQLQRAFRGQDVVARWGGEEFLVGMYGMASGDAVRRLSEVLEAFQGHTFASPDGSAFRSSFSGGVAERTSTAADLATLYREADTALYAAKAAGRGRVLASGEATEATSTVYVDVVLVEDDEALAPLVLHALDSRGLRTHWLRAGDVAAEQLAGPTPLLHGRVVVLDWDLPGLNGPALLQQLADNGTLASTRVIMLTGRSREDDVLRVLRLGAADHVAKPFSLPVLLQRIRQQLGADAPP